MRCLAIVMMVGLAGCQIIINHNTFEPAEDAGVDSPSNDAPLVPNANAITTPATTPMVVAGAMIGWTTSSDPYLSSQDGSWIQTVTSNGEPSSARLALHPNVFEMPPRCFCSSAGGNSHDCNLTASSTTTTVELELWNPIGPPRVAYVWCIGESSSGAPGELRWTGTGQAMLASASSGLAGIFQDGGDAFGWFDDTQFVIPGSGGNARGFHFRKPFLDVPTCSTTTIVPVGGRFSAHLAVPTGRSWVLPGPSSGTDKGMGNGPSPTRFDFVCLGSIVSPEGASHVVSPSPAGARIATATIAADGTAESSDGGWVMSSSLNADAVAVLSILPNTFSSPPRCWCSIESDDTSIGHVCTMVVDPTTSKIEIDRFDIEDGDFVAPKPQVARRTHVACMQTN